MELGEWVWCVGRGGRGGVGGAVWWCVVGRREDERGGVRNVDGRSSGMDWGADMGEDSNVH